MLISYMRVSKADGSQVLDLQRDALIAKFGFVELVELEDMLARELGLNVQLGTHDALHPLIKSNIEREAVRVF